MISNKTKNFLERYGSNTSQDSSKMNQLEEELINNPDILNELSSQLDSLFIQTEEDPTTIPSKLTSLNLLYKNLLNKYNLRDFLKLSLACLNKSLPYNQVQTKLRENALFDYLSNGSMADLQSQFDLPKDFQQQEGEIRKYISTIDINSVYEKLESNVEQFNQNGTLIKA